MSGVASVPRAPRAGTSRSARAAVRIPKRRAPRTSASTSSVTSQVSSGSASSASSAAAKYDGLGLPRTVASTPVAYSSPATKPARVEHRPAARLPPLVLVQAVERGAQADLLEGAGEVHVAEDLVRLDRLVAASDQHRVDVVTDEVEPVEVGDDRGHHESEDSLARELPRGGAGRRLQLLVLEREAHLAQLAREARSRAGRVVRDEAQEVPARAELCDGVGGARDRRSGDVEHAVDVEQNAGHGA